METGADVCIVDTAGRLQTQQNLMQELTKIHRVLGKQIPDAPHEVLLVLDATTGQNGISQARHFTDAVRCTGMVLAKLDGTAKGGVVVAIRKQVGLPVKYIGVGEEGRRPGPVRARPVRRRPVCRSGGEIGLDRRFAQPAKLFLPVPLPAGEFASGCPLFPSIRPVGRDDRSIGGTEPSVTRRLSLLLIPCRFSLPRVQV